MNLGEKENYGQDDPYFQNDNQDPENDIDAPPFDNSFASEDQYQQPDLDIQQNNLGDEGESEEEDGLDDSNLKEEENLENEDSIEEEQNERFKKEEDSNNRNHNHGRL